MEKKINLLFLVLESMFFENYGNGITKKRIKSRKLLVKTYQDRI